MVIAPSETNKMTASPAEAMASLRFIGRDIDPALISKYLNIKPSAVYPPPSVDAALPQQHRANMWRLDSGLPATEPLIKHLRSLIKKLSPIRDDLRRLENETGWSPCFYCGYFYESDQGGQIELPPAILRDIADLGATLDLRVYSDDDSDEEGHSPSLSR